MTQHLKTRDARRSMLSPPARQHESAQRGIVKLYGSHVPKVRSPPLGAQAGVCGGGDSEMRERRGGMVWVEGGRDSLGGMCRNAW